jgi:hypothetical protein
MSRDRPNLLFNKIDWFSVRENQRRQMAEEIARYDGNKLLNTSVEDLSKYFDEKYRIEVPMLREEEITADQREAQIDVSRDPMRFIRDRDRPFHVAGTLIEITVPFKGEAEVFNIQPSTFTASPPIADIIGDNLIIQISGTDLTSEQVRSRVDRTINEIKSYLESLRNDVKDLNDSLLATAKEAINQRRAKLLKDQSLVAGLGFPLRDRKDAPRTYVAPDVRRKIQLRPPAATTAPFVPEPELELEHYEHILRVVQNMTHVMERSPSAFASMDEEALRTHFLVQLNGHFEGAATGETFNYTGKTDILIRVEGKNIFIGECKFWSGAKNLSETIDQILGYSSWRDTKTAVIIFNKRKNFSSVIKAIPPTVEAHPNFKRSLGQQSETSFRYIMSHRDDPNRELILC